MTDGVNTFWTQIVCQALEELAKKVEFVGGAMGALGGSNDCRSTLRGYKPRSYIMLLLATYEARLFCNRSQNKSWNSSEILSV